ncbi:MAG TPA: hypothetical protein VGM05_30650 [Planctomycetaceae bacterium]
MNLGPHKVQVPVGTRSRNGKIEVGTKSTPIHSSIVTALRNIRRETASESHSDVCRVYIDKQTTFVIFHSYGDEYAVSLFCLKAATGEVVWQSEAWGRTGHRHPMLGAWFYHPVELAATREIVAVFGVHSHFVEGFEIATGKPAFRFNPDLWEGPIANGRPTADDENRLVKMDVKAASSR